MKNKVTILDCTLRDGGYVNDWKFGLKASEDVYSAVREVGVDYAEVGFLRNESNQEGRMVFDSIEAANALFLQSQTKRALIVEQGYDFPIETLPYRDETSIELIRVMMWKRNVVKALDYCKSIADKGYEVAIQATRTDEYTDDEFLDLVKLYNTIQPKAVYVVDSFGVFTREDTLRYATIADEYLDEGIALGLHLHNNQQQALVNTVAFLDHAWQHPIMIDATIMGMGKGAGNLPLELLLRELDSRGMENYKIDPLLKVMDTHINQYAGESVWGYQIPYFLSSIYGRNPSYATLMAEKHVPYAIQNKVFALMKKEGKGIKMNTEELGDYLKRV